MSVGTWLIDTCCCDGETPVGSCITSDVIGSCLGLITDPDCGIKPTIGEMAVLVQQCAGYNANATCVSPTGDVCVYHKEGTAAAPREATYTLEGDVDGLPPCHWIWYSKARAIAFDVNFPSTNRCCCKGEYYTFTCDNPYASPCATPWECDCAGLSSNHGANTDEICTGLSGCQSVGSYDYERDGGSPPGVIPPGVGGIGNNVFFSKYPAATNGEEGEDDFGSNPAVLTRDLAGLTAYQLRVTELAYPWVWEINRFNSGLPVKINGASYTYTRPDGNEGSAYKYRGSDPSVTNQNSTGGHPLFRYFHAFAHPEFAWKKTQDFAVTTGTTQTLWQQTTPYKFYFVADGFPVFAFELSSEERGVFYPSQQYDGGLIDATLMEYTDAVDALLKGGTWVSRASAKDWRGEVFADLQTLATWGNAQSPIWSDPQDVLDAIKDDPAELKIMFPNRLNGDAWDVRAIDATTGATTSVRPPALAVAATAATGGGNYTDSITSEITGQVDSSIYDMVEPSVGLSGMPATEADAFKRLTRSIYFRTQPAGWDWSVAAHEGISTMKPRYNWLNNRQQGDVNLNQALRWTCKVTDPPCGYDNVWCTNGLPQVSRTTTNCAGESCIGNICDLYMGHAGYAGNVNVLVGRGEFPHVKDNQVFTCCEPIPLSAHAASNPVQSFTNICFFRHAGRPYWWDTSVAPYAMTLTSSLVPPEHPIDSIPTCAPFPAISTQNESGAGAVQFCNDQPGCGTYCATSCSDYSYSVYIPFCTLEDCSQTLSALNVPLRPPGSIAGQREAPYIGYSTCIITAPPEDDNCICPGDCSLVFPVVVATPPPP